MRQKPRFPGHGGMQQGREDLSSSAASSFAWPVLHGSPLAVSPGVPVVPAAYLEAHGAT